MDKYLCFIGILLMFIDVDFDILESSYTRFLVHLFCLLINLLTTSGKGIGYFKKNYDNLTVKQYY